MADTLPLIFGGAALAVGITLLGGGIKLTLHALTLRTKGLKTQAVIDRIDVREVTERHDDTTYIAHYYTEVVRFTTWDGQPANAKLPTKNEKEPRGSVGDTIDITYNPDAPSLAAPVHGSSRGIIGPILIAAGAALSLFAAYFLQNMLA